MFKQKEGYETPKHHISPTEKDIWKYRNVNNGNQISVTKTRPEKDCQKENE